MSQEEMPKGLLDKIKRCGGAAIRWVDGWLYLPRGEYVGAGDDTGTWMEFRQTISLPLGEYLQSVADSDWWGSCPRCGDDISKLYPSCKCDDV